LGAEASTGFGNCPKRTDSVDHDERTKLKTRSLTFCQTVVFGAGAPHGTLAFGAFSSQSYFTRTPTERRLEEAPGSAPEMASPDRTLIEHGLRGADKREHKRLVNQ
jgi:hypothetical protein